MALGFLAGLAGRAVPFLDDVVRMGARAVGSAPARQAARVATNPAVQGAAGATAATVALSPSAPIAPPSAPPNLANFPQFPTASAGTAALGTTNAGIPIMAAGVVESRLRCPKGYVTVTDPQTGAKMCMLKGVARAMGLWKARRKPPISAGDWKQYKTAERVEKKLAGIAKKEGFTKRRR